MVINRKFRIISPIFVSFMQNFDIKVRNCALFLHGNKKENLNSHSDSLF